MLIYLLYVLAGVAYLNAGYDLASKEKAKSKKQDWDKFNKDWARMMLYLPITTFVIGTIKIMLFPALRRHSRRIGEVEAQKELDAEEDPKLLEEGKKGAERAAKGVPDPDDEKPEQLSGLGEVLNPKVLAPKEPPDK